MPPEISNRHLLTTDVRQFRLFDNDQERTCMVSVKSLDNSQNWYKLWHRLVAEHSVRKLTDQTDKLPVIAGMADRMQGWFKETYSAGLWAENMLGELLWQRSSSIKSIINTSDDFGARHIWK
ncbi:hypothetical protein ONS96_004433 [Cadophora gregata f. sp. sojae]|nr:hypothetical protein ONS96_004433 [Cadophora gregata f. sp. sojae]